MPAAIETSEVARKKSPKAPPTDMAKIASDVMQNARVVVTFSGESLTDYLSRLLRDQVAKDRADAIRREAAKLPKAKN